MSPDVYSRPDKVKTIPVRERGDGPTVDPVTLPAPVEVHRSTECLTTPERVVLDYLLPAAEVEPWHHVLEPSAGTGAIVRHLPEDCLVVVFEKNPTLCGVLRGMGYDARPTDFLQMQPGRVLFDRVIMNPPFSQQQDMQHVRHAFDFLKPGGRLVAIMSPAWTYGQRGHAPAFREWMAERVWHWQELPAGSFEDSGTGANAGVFVIEKEEAI